MRIFLFLNTLILTFIFILKVFVLRLECFLKGFKVTLYVVEATKKYRVRTRRIAVMINNDEKKKKKKKKFIIRSIN